MKPEPAPVPAPGQVRGAAKIEVLDRRPVARPAGDGTQEEILVEVMAAGQAVAADQVRVLPLEIERREDRPAEHAASQSRRVSLENVQHAVRIGLAGLVPAAGGDGPRGVAAESRPAEHGPEPRARACPQARARDRSPSAGRRPAPARRAGDRPPPRHRRGSSFPCRGRHEHRRIRATPFRRASRADRPARGGSSSRQGRRESS